MDWVKPSPELGVLLEAAVRYPLAQKKTMFGAPVYVVNSNMFTGVHGRSIFLRLSEADRAEMQATIVGVVPFEPVPGHIMAEYVALPEALYRDVLAFQPWLDRSYQFAISLPAKAPKPRRVKKAKS